MFAALRHKCFGLVIALTFIAGLVASASGHAAAARPEPAQTAWAAHLQSLWPADLCAGDKPAPDDQTPCPACRLIAAAVLPAPLMTASPAGAPALPAAAPWRDIAPRTQSFAAPPPVRAPPLA